MSSLLCNRLSSGSHDDLEKVPIFSNEEGIVRMRNGNVNGGRTSALATERKRICYEGDFLDYVRRGHEEWK